MRRSLLLFSLLWLQLQVLAQGANVAARWNEANNAYQNKQYELAIDKYRELLNDTRKDADVYYNLGNAYFKNEENGRAIASYLSALKIDPGMLSARQNLEFVRSRMIRSIPEEEPMVVMKWAHAFVGLLSANIWAWAALVMSILLSFLYYVKKREGAKKRTALWIAGAFCLFFFACSIAAYKNDHIGKKAVVIRSNSFLYQDIQRSKVKWNLPEGTIIKVEGKTKGDLLEVELDNGIQGWLDATDVEQI